MSFNKPMISGDPEHDAWLLQALRHAPDHDAAPPAALSETILNEARSKLGRARPVNGPARRAGQHLWDWLGRPWIAPSLASVMLGVVITVMWWDRPLRDEDEPRAPPVLATPDEHYTPAPEAPPTVRAPPATTSPSVAKPKSKPLGQQAPAPSRGAAARAVEPRSVATSDSLHSSRSGAANADGAKITDLDPERRRSASAEHRDKILNDEESASRAPTPPASDRATVAQEANTRAQPQMAARLATKRSPPATVAAAVTLPPSNASTAEASAPPTQSPALAIAAAKLAAPTNAAALPRRTLDALRSTLASEPAPWRWQLDGGTPRAVDASLLAWLGQLDAATTAKWAAPTVSDAPAEASQVQILRLSRDGHAQDALHIGPHGVRWEHAQDADLAPIVWQALLDDDAVQALRSALRGLAR